MNDYVTCPNQLSVEMRRTLHTTRMVCRTLVEVTEVPMMCPVCGCRVT